VNWLLEKKINGGRAKVHVCCSEGLEWAPHTATVGQQVSQWGATEDV